MLAAEKAKAAKAAKDSPSFEGTAAGSATGEKRGSSSQDPIHPVAARQRHSTRLSTSPEVSSTPTPNGGDVQIQQPESAGAAPAISSAVTAQTAAAFDPVAAGSIASNLIFGPFGCLGEAALEDMIKLPRDRLAELAVALQIFPDVDSTIKVKMPALRHLVSASTGKVDTYAVDPDTKSFSFPDGIELEGPLFLQPAA